MREFTGILFIGDPHLASRVPGFRKDDYPNSILAKVAWCLEYAREHRLLPALLGDLFHQPRDNSNWLLGEFLAMLGRQLVIGVYGNHDCREDHVTDNDSLSVIVKSGLLQLVNENHPWFGTMTGRTVVIGGTSWGKMLPRSFRMDGRATSEHPIVFWMAHHDVRIPGYEDQGRFDPYEIDGVDVVINGHIHRPLHDVRAGRTLWITPGNIARVARSDITRQHLPAALKITFQDGEWQRQAVTIPHQPFADVFHPEMQTMVAETTASAFVQGLAELQARRTEAAAGLKQFLELNQEKFEPQVRAEIWELYKEIEHNEHEAKDESVGQ
jgi:predicted phosphodiesterase